jgi:acetyl esterase/lipase
MVRLILMVLAIAVLSTTAIRGATPTTPAIPVPRPTLPTAPLGIIILEDVAYLSPDREEKLDLYLPTNRPMGLRSPAVVIIHGGGWLAGDKAGGREFNIGTTLAKAGYVCASVNYSLRADNRWPTDLYDCKNAVRFLRVNSWRYHVDPEHIGVIGGSAGGHLTLMVGYTSEAPALEPKAPYPGISDKVQAVVDLYGLADLFTRQKTDAQGNPTGRRITSSAFMKGTPKDNPEGWKLGSPVYHISKNSPPTLILHGTIDTTIDRDQSTELAKKLEQAGVEHQLFLLKDVGHTFDLQSWNHKPLPIDVKATVIGFFDKYLRVK